MMKMMKIIWIHLLLMILLNHKKLKNLKINNFEYLFIFYYKFKKSILKSKFEFMLIFIYRVLISLNTI